MSFFLSGLLAYVGVEVESFAEGADAGAGGLILLVEASGCAKEEEQGG